MMPQARRTSGIHHGDLRRALEEAAARLVTERGVADFSLAEVCRRAGVSVSAPYKHYADRDELLVAVAVRACEDHRRLLHDAVDGAQDPIEQLGAFAEAYVRLAVDRTAMFRLTTGAGPQHHAALGAARARMLDCLLPPATALAGAGAAIDLAVCVTAGAHGMASLLMDGALGSRADVPAIAVTRAAELARSLGRAYLGGACRSAGATDDGEPRTTDPATIVDLR